MQDWLNVIQHDPSSGDNLYMYIIKPTHEQDTDRWDGKISQIRKLIDRRFDELLALNQQSRHEAISMKEKQEEHQES